jgi:glycyl-tRNA synthetase beta chain
VGCFRAGVIPSGSQDHFALRRQALGVLQIILENRYAVSLEDLVQVAQRQYVGKAKPNEGKEILEFLKTRLQSVLETRGLSYDVINAVTATEASTLIAMVEKVETVQKYKSEPDFQKLVTAAGRVLRILPEKKISDKVSKPLLKLDEEKDLFEKIQSARKLIADTDPESQNYYERVMNHLKILVPPIHAFFEKVMVMDKNVKIRANRLALLKQASEMLLVLCDFRKLVFATEIPPAN